ncbi:MAG: hypothetical protein ACP59X_14280 [Solidesulfovibrio sp. DCME]|uniref:hypothetical protein n=1 Tax=Solidesulfovibrio sp. DCME TaxID=3447380 RepID=UPI003D0D0E26
MSRQTITVTDVSGNNPVTVPVRPHIDREGACLDLIIVTAVHVGCPVTVRLSLRTDGTIHFWKTDFDGPDNTYAHIDPQQYNQYSGKPHAPTEAQRLTVARWWAGVEKPLGLHGGVGGTLMQWAFDGMSVIEMEDRYLDGLRVALA